MNSPTDVVTVVYPREKSEILNLRFESSVIS